MLALFVLPPLMLPPFVFLPFPVPSFLRPLVLPPFMFPMPLFLRPTLLLTARAATILIVEIYRCRINWDWLSMARLRQTH
jgi:hypothetical protein